MPPPPPKWLRFVYGLVGYDWQAKAQTAVQVKDTKHAQRLLDLGAFDSPAAAPRA